MSNNWRAALSLIQLRTQLNTRYPHRSTASDGMVGDAAHRTRDSDHNPWVDGGVVTAFDITDDILHGCQVSFIAEAIRASRDPRVKYVIYNRRMFSSYVARGVPAWEWRPYTGSNPHVKHMHISVQPDVALYDSPKPWRIC